MTSHELAIKLLKLPDVMVTRRGYEGGVSEITEASEPRRLVLNVHNGEWYHYGEHEYTEEPNDYPYATSIQAIHIN